MKDDLVAGYVYMEISAARAHGTIAAGYIVLGDGRCGDGVFDSAAVAACVVGDKSLYFRHDGELSGVSCTQAVFKESHHVDIHMD